MENVANQTTDSQPESEPGEVASSAAIGDIALLDQQITQLGPDSSNETIARIRNMVSFIGQEARRLKQSLDQALIERIQETGQDIVLSDTVRLYLGTPPKYTVVDNMVLLDAIISLRGCIDDIGQVLASGWCKAGALRSILEEAGRSEIFDMLITTTREPEIKEGKPVKKLMETNGFSRSRKGSPS